jgi:drug/metabolite transporter (DMT)-like permease
MTSAGILILLWLILFRRRECRKVQKIKAFIATILLWGLAGSWFFINALRSTDSLGFVFVLIGLQPVFTIITSAIVLWEHPRGSFYAFAATAIFASILLSMGDTGWNIGSWSTVSYLYALGVAASWWSSTTFGKIVFEHNSPIFALGLRFLCTGFIAGWLVVLLGEQINIHAISESVKEASLSLLFIIFIWNILGYGLFSYGLRAIPATIATIFELAFPLTGFVLDYTIYDVAPSPVKIVAALTILVSIIILPHCHFIEERWEVLRQTA